MRTSHWSRLPVAYIFLVFMLLESNFLFGASPPVLTSLSPSSAPAGTTGFVLTVNGSNFVSGARVLWNQFGLYTTTTFVGSAQLKAAISDSVLQSPGTAEIAVQNPDGGTSNAMTFTITAGGFSNPVPAIAFLSPSSGTAGGPAFTLSVNGSSLINSSVVRWNGANRPTTFVSSSQVTASITASDIAAAGTAQVTVASPAPGGGTSNPLTFTINPAATPNPAPVLISLTPSSATAGGPAFTLTVNGSNFISSLIVQWNGVNRTTTFGSSTQLTAAIPAADIAAAGTAQVTVVNPSPGGGTSNALTFTIDAGTTPNPGLVLTSLSPSSSQAGGRAFTLTAYGSNFVNGTVVQWNGSPRPTTFISSTQLTAAISASDIAAVGTIPVTVSNPAPRGGTSNAIPFSVTGAAPPHNPVPRIIWVSPVSALAGGPDLKLTLSGANFTSSSVVQWNQTPLATTFVNSNQLIAVVPASATAKPGLANLSVVNPAPGGGTSQDWTYPFTNSGVVNFPGGPQPFALAPSAVAVDPVLGRIYAVHRHLFRENGVNGGQAPTEAVTVAEQQTGNIITTIGVGLSNNGQHQGIAVNSTRHLVYVTNEDDGTVTVIDGTMNTTLTTTTVDASPGGIAVDPNIGVVYVAAQNVTLLDAATGAVITSIPVGGPAVAVAVDSNSGLAWFLVNSIPATVVAIDGAARAIRTQVSLPSQVISSYSGIAVDPGSRVYVSQFTSGMVWPIDTTAAPPVVGTSFSGAPQYAEAVGVDPGSHSVYVVDSGNNAVNIFTKDGTTKLTAVTVLRHPVAITIDPNSSRAYVADVQSGSLSVIDTVQKAVIGTLPLATLNWGLAYDSATRRLYGANIAADAVSVVDAGTQKVLGSWNSGGGTFSTAVDPGLQQVYSLSVSDGALSIFSAADGSLKSKLNLGQVRNGVVAVNSTTNMVYVSNGELPGTVTVVNGKTNRVAGTIPVGDEPIGIAIDEIAGRIYVANNVSGTISVVDAGTNQVIAMWKPQLNSVWGLAVDSALKRLYVTIPSGGFIGAFTGLEVLDSTTGAFIAQIPSGQPSVAPPGLDASAESVVVNAATHHVFFGDAGNGTVTVVDGLTNTALATLVPGTRAQGLAVDAASGAVYVSNMLDGTISAISDQFCSASALPPSISQLSPSSATAGGPAFTLTVTGSNFVPGTVVRWNGSSRPTTYVSSTQLQTVISANDIARPGSVLVSVATPEGATSNALAFTISSTLAPIVNPGGIVNAGAAGSPSAPGSIGSLYGANFASSIILADTVPLPTSLGGVSVQINGISAPLYAVSSTQINFQFPWELLGTTQATVVVSVNGVKSPPQTVMIAPVGPAIFTLNSQGTGQGIIQIASTPAFAAPAGSIPGVQTRPARKDEYLTIYCNGLGDVTNRPVTGAPALSNPLSTTLKPTVSIGGISAPVSFSGLVPNLVGIYQVNVQVPDNAPTGNAVPLVITAGGVASNTVTVAIQ